MDYETLFLCKILVNFSAWADVTSPSELFGSSLKLLPLQKVGFMSNLRLRKPSSLTSSVILIVWRVMKLQQNDIHLLYRPRIFFEGRVEQEERVPSSCFYIWKVGEVSGYKDDITTGDCTCQRGQFIVSFVQTFSCTCGENIRISPVNFSYNFLGIVEDKRIFKIYPIYFGL